jgi:conjugal transfer pilus assembly protein TraK
VSAGLASRARLCRSDAAGRRQWHRPLRGLGQDLTRISLKDDQFASVSKVQAANPSDDFQVVNEPLRGDIYLSVANGFSKPTISFFGTTRKGFVYKFICAVGGNDARQVFIANADVEHPRPVGAAWPAGLSPRMLRRV